VNGRAADPTDWMRCFGSSSWFNSRRDDCVP
jgi:hypothetical protein